MTTGVGLAVFLMAAAPDDVALGLAEFRQGRFAEALRDWQAAAEAGEPRGALYLGVLYDTGIGVSQNFTEALDWYKQAAEEGSAVGAFNAGVLYDAGLGVSPDQREAARWYQRAAAQGFGRAEYNLGMLYQSGSGVPRNRARAIAFFRSAAAHGVSAARTHLAVLGVRFSGPTAAAQQSALQDFQQAQKMITSRSPAEVQKATELFRQSAEQHNALAEYDLGYCYERGLGVPVDNAQALAWYKRAAADAKDRSLQSVAQSGVDYLQRLSSGERTQ